MKPRTILLSIYLAASILCVISLGHVITGCSTTQQRTAVNSLFTVGQSVDSAYKAYLDGVVAGQIKTNDVPAISKNYADFQTAFGIAVSLAAMSSNAPPSPDVMNAASQVFLSIKAAKGK